MVCLRSHLVTVPVMGICCLYCLTLSSVKPPIGIFHLTSVSNCINENLLILLGWTVTMSLWGSKNFFSFAKIRTQIFYIKSLSLNQCTNAAHWLAETEGSYWKTILNFSGVCFKINCWFNSFRTLWMWPDRFSRNLNDYFYWLNVIISFQLWIEVRDN